MFAKLRQSPPAVIALGAVLAVLMTGTSFAMVTGQPLVPRPASAVLGIEMSPSESPSAPPTMEPTPQPSSSEPEPSPSEPEPSPSPCEPGDPNSCQPKEPGKGVTPVYRIGDFNLTVIRTGSVLQLYINAYKFPNCKVTKIAWSFTKGDKLFVPKDELLKDLADPNKDGNGRVFQFDYTTVAAKDLKGVEGTLTVSYKCPDVEEKSFNVKFTYDPTREPPGFVTG